MQLILQNCFKNEVSARQEYFYNTFNLWLVISQINDDYIRLTSIPTGCLDVLFIVGHNIFVKDYLQKNELLESVIVAITCDGTVHFSNMKLPHKTLYIPFQNKNNLVELLKGSSYGFSFNLTKSEILFYRTNKLFDLNKRLETCFYKL